MTDPGDQTLYRPPREAPDDPRQLGLFAPRARTTDPDTSHEAADSMTDAADTQRRQILEALEGGPMTADALDAALGWRVTSAGRRLPELREMGRVVMMDDKRMTRSGRRARLWRLT